MSSLIPCTTCKCHVKSDEIDAGNPTVDAGGQNDGATDAGDAKKL
jgi:hypothetical protein